MLCEANGVNFRSSPSADASSSMRSRSRGSAGDGDTRKPSKLTTHPGSDTRNTKSAHVLQACTAHGEVAHEVPNQRGDLEDGGNKSQDEALDLELEKKTSQQEVLDGGVFPMWAVKAKRGCVVVICR